MSIYHVTESKGGGINADRSSFVGAKIPIEIKALVKPLKQVNKSTVQKVLQVIVHALEGKDVEEDSLLLLQTSSLTEETLAYIYTGLYKLVQTALRIPNTSLKPEVFKEDCKELHIPDEFIEDIASVVFGTRRNSIDEEALRSRPRLPKLDSFRWKLDVTISTSVLSRVLEPTILMEMVLSDGKVQEFEVPVSKFNELRYSVAYVLKEMQALEKRSILKIQD